MTNRFSALKLDDEPGRIAAVQRYQVLDSGAEGPFDKITDLVRTLIGVPVAAVSLIDRDRQWFKAIDGLAISQTPRGDAFCDHTIRAPGPLVVRDTTADARFADNPLVTEDPHLRAYAGVPLRTPDGYHLGALCAIDRSPRDFSAGDLAILAKLAALVEDQLELRTIASEDHLTRALSRRAFVETAEQEIARYRRYKRAGSLVVLDIDRFKSINDRFGHPAGDTVLRAVATACRAALRPTDSFGRLGGEEFAVLMPETPLPDAVAAAERMRQVIAALPPAFAGGPDVTASFGIATLGRHFGTGWDSWLSSADAALYEAKRGGRNCCVAAASLVADSGA